MPALESSHCMEVYINLSVDGLAVLVWQVALLLVQVEFCRIMTVFIMYGKLV